MSSALLLATLLGTTASNPCAVLDLPSAMQLSVRRSDEVAIAQAERLAAQSDLALAKAAAFIPLATATLITGPVPAAHGTVVESTQSTSNRNLNGLAPFGRVEVNVVQPLWTWGQLDAAKDAATQGVAARNALVADVTSKVQLRLVQLYLGHTLARRLLTIAADVEKALVEVDEKIAEALETHDNSITPNDRYRVELFRSQLLQKRAEAQKGFELSQIGAAALLALDSSGLNMADLTLDTAAQENVPELAPLLGQADSQRKDLVALGHAISAREALVRAADAAKLPVLFLAGQLTFAYAPNRDLQTNPWVHDPFRDIGGGIVLGLRQNLSFPLLFAQADKARAEVETLQRQREGLRRLVRVEVESARSELTAGRTRYLAAQSGATTAKSWFRSAQLNFGVGVEDAKTLIDAYTGYVESQVGLASAGYTVLAAKAQLDQLTGTALSHGEATCVPP